MPADFNYEAIVATSERVAWTVHGVLDGRRFDTARPFVPETWMRLADIDFLDEQQSLLLNQIRAFSYIHMLGNFEELIVRHMTTLATGLSLDDPAQARALFRFCDEEMKHQELFLAAERQMEADVGVTFGRFFDVERTVLHGMTQQFMTYPPLARAIILQAFEWGTQRHYRESVQLGDGPLIDMLYADLLKFHWLEESQHVKVGELEIRSMAARVDAGQISEAFDDVLEIAGLIGQTFIGQVEQEIATLERETAPLSEAQRERLQQALLASMSAIWAEVAMTNPDFHHLARELSAEGAAKLGIA